MPGSPDRRSWRLTVRPGVPAHVSVTGCGYRRVGRCRRSVNGVPFRRCGRSAGSSAATSEGRRTRTARRHARGGPRSAGSRTATCQNAADVPDCIGLACPACRCAPAFLSAIATKAIAPTVRACAHRSGRSRGDRAVATVGVAPQADPAADGRWVPVPRTLLHDPTVSNWCSDLSRSSPRRPQRRSGTPGRREEFVVRVQAADGGPPVWSAAPSSPATQ